MELWERNAGADYHLVDFQAATAAVQTGASLVWWPEEENEIDIEIEATAGVGLVAKLACSNSDSESLHLPPGSILGCGWCVKALVEGMPGLIGMRLLPLVYCSGHLCYDA